MRKVYVIPTYHCNLKCPHCELHLKEDNFSEKFFKILDDIKSPDITLFGGEPTLYRERLKRCLETEKISSISTNLLILDAELISLYKYYGISIATSWNPKRFTEEQYKLWVENLRKLEENGLKCIILITLTEDLLSYENFNSLLKEWDNIESIEGILFEPLLDYQMSRDLHERADLWICSLYDEWNFRIRNLIADKVMKWDCNCSDVWTLNPNGQLSRGCPQFEKKFVLNECLGCNLAGICRPCHLQHICSFPKNLYKKVLENANLASSSISART